MKFRLNSGTHWALTPVWPIEQFSEKTYRAWHDTFVTDSTLRWEVQLRKGCVELAVLAALREERLYGLQILRRLEYFSGLTISEGTIYPLLSRLQTAGWAESEWQETPLGHPRRYYMLTPSGRNRLLEMSRSWSKLAANIDQLLTRLESRPVEVPALSPVNYPCP